MTELYSFDVFDTCITRTFSEPEHLFIELARMILLENNRVASEEAINLLAAQRCKAESNARKKSTQEDIQLISIYDELSLLHDPALDLSTMLSKEIELEINSAIPIHSTLSRYKEIHASGIRIIFVSDMYLPKATVLLMLNQCGFEVQHQDLYLSGDIGLKKRTTNLYKHILQKENLSPESITHHGDHLVSDIRMAKACGLNTVHIPAPKMAARYEALLLQRNNYWQKWFYNLQAVSRHIRKFYRAPISKLPTRKIVALSRLTAISRILLRNQSETSPLNVQLQAIGYFVAAPLFTSFVTWLLDTAHAKGIEKLYFVARNGQIFYRLAQQINDARNYNIELRYLYGSRAAWYPASFDAFDSEFVDLLLRKYPQKSATNILKDLGLPRQKIAIISAAMQRSAHHDGNAVDKENVKAALIWLSNSEHSEIVSEHFTSCWRNIVDYLSQEEIFDQAKFGIVDIGWHLSTHNALHRILSKTNKGGFTGFYFGVGKKHENVAEEAPYYAYISDETSSSHSWLFKLGAMSLLEEVFASADHPTTSGYFRDGARVFPRMEKTSENAESHVVKAIQDAMLEFSSFVIEHEFLDELNLIHTDVLAQFERFYKFPTAQEAQSIADTPVYALTSHSKSQKRTLAHAIRSGELLGIVFKVIFSGRNIAPKWVWLPGSMAMSNSFVATTGKLLSFLEFTIQKLKNRPSVNDS